MAANVTSKLGQIAVFPMGDHREYSPEFGLSYRQWLVGMALQGMLANPRQHDSTEEYANNCGDSFEQCIAEAAVSHADAVLAELEKQP